MIEAYSLISWVLHLAAMVSLGATLPHGNASGDASGNAAVSDGEAADELANLVGSGGLWVEHESLPPFLIPENEQLDFDVVLNLKVASPTVGKFILSAGVEDYVPPLSAEPSPDVEEDKTAWIRGHAHGAHQAYTLDHVIEARILPQQEWPRVVYRDTQKGSENRRRELKYGRKSGVDWAWYRQDHHCYGCGQADHKIKKRVWFTKRKMHCDGCRRMGHRVWHDSKEFEIPNGSLDMLNSVYATRTMVRQGIDRMEITMLDREKRWDVVLTRGERKAIKTPAGTFDCVAIKLDPRPPEGSDQKSRFKGLFGVRGSLSIWLEENTGIPVRLEGIVPLGVISLDVHLELTKYKGTPEVFAGR